MCLQSFLPEDVSYWWQNDRYSTEITFASFERRGKHTPHNKTPYAIIEDVRNHIESFPTVEAHYTRQDTKRRFLRSDLNISKLY
jgi:hypothetical protein